MSPLTSNRIRALWDRVSPLPGGHRLFSVMLGRMAPYTGSIHASVVELGSGYSKVMMKDRRSIRNHLDSVHAIALMNLAELASGLALHYDLPGHARAILTGLSIEYLKKARGELTAEGRSAVPGGHDREELEVSAVIVDEAGDEVARATARWLVGPRDQKE